MTDPRELAQAWAAERKLSPTSSVLALASRQICAAGRLAALRPPLLMPWIVRVETTEHGDDGSHLDQGTAHAIVWVLSSDDQQTQRLASTVHSAVRASAWAANLLLTVEVRRATLLDRLRAWLAWRIWRRVHKL